MPKQEYYYLVAGLPELDFLSSYVPFTPKAFREDLPDKLESKDFELVCHLLYARDNYNVLNILFDRTDSITYEGNYSSKELKKGIEGTFVLPLYISNFIFNFHESKSKYNEYQWAALLHKSYVQEVERLNNDFLNSWMRFEWELKKILFETSKTRLITSLPKLFTPSDEGIDDLFQNSSNRFYHERSIDIVGGVEKIIGIRDILEREKKIDFLRWRQLEAFALFEYFTIEAILVFIIKLMINERWMKLQQNKKTKFLPSLFQTYTKQT